MLKDIAKVLIGIVFSDMVVGVWIMSTNMLPMRFFGLEWGFLSTMFAVLADFVVLILLIYYAWVRKPRQKKEIVEE